MLFIIKESLTDLKRTMFSSLLTIMLIFISLFIANIYFITKNNIENSIKKLKSEFKIELFFNLGSTDEAIKNIILDLENENEVDTVVLITKEQALELFKKEFKDDPIETIGYNPLPQSLRITVAKKYANKETVNSLISNYLNSDKYKNIIDEVHFENFLDTLELFNKNAKKIGFILFSIISALTILLIFNNIRLTIKYKEEIIHTMKLVGASNFMIRIPFVFGGILMGTIAALLSVISMKYFLSSINTIFSNLSINSSHSYSNFLIESLSINDIYIIFFFGISIGIIGSWTSASRYLPKY